MPEPKPKATAQPEQAQHQQAQAYLVGETATPPQRQQGKHAGQRRHHDENRGLDHAQAVAQGKQQHENQAINPRIQHDQI